jgi:hypothetical protein
MWLLASVIVPCSFGRACGHSDELFEPKEITLKGHPSGISRRNAVIASRMDNNFPPSIDPDLSTTKMISDEKPECAEGKRTNAVVRSLPLWRIAGFPCLILTRLGRVRTVERK